MSLAARTLQDVFINAFIDASADIAASRLAIETWQFSPPPQPQPILPITHHTDFLVMHYYLRHVNYGAGERVTRPPVATSRATLIEPSLFFNILSVSRDILKNIELKLICGSLKNLSPNEYIHEL
jgi:hypothetical protein